MARYRVVEEFSDILDGGYMYKAGDFYPRFGYTPTEARLKVLGSTANALGRKLIDYAPAKVEKVAEAEDVPTPTPKRKRTKKQ